MTTVAIETLGCKLNQAESETLARELLAAGFRMVSPDDGAEVCILNTCTVTHVADRKARHLLRLARRRHPQAFLVAAGCYAERAPEELRHLGVVDLVSSSDKSALVEGLCSSKTVSCLEESRASDLTGRQRFSKTSLRTRSLVKVQEGCSAFCAYCIVPYVRGRERSFPVDQVIQEVRERIDEGCKEVVLTGTRIGSYHHDGADLKRLVERILAETGIARLRLSSLQPGEVTPGMLSLWADPRLCRHFHLSLQSGSAETIGRMRRGYSLEEYRSTLVLIRESVPGVAITTDVIVGFPGETTEEFEEGYRFCLGMTFANIHVFPYSPRSGTEAAEMPGQVTEPVKRERKERMLRLAREGAGHFRERFLGQRASVLWERGEGGLCSGLTDNYIRVLAPGGMSAVNEVRPVKIVGQDEGCLRGEF